MEQQTMKEYRVALVNGKYGYGKTAYLALIDAVGTRKADLICDNLADNQRMSGKRVTFWAKNGAEIGMIEQVG